MKPDFTLPIDKNIRLTEAHVLENIDDFKKMGEDFINYPDLFIDWITPKDSNFELYFYQRIFLRACLRYRYVYTVAPRAFSKSFISILAGYLRCMFLPGKQFLAPLVRKDY